jgi:hypothetical protein
MTVPLLVPTPSSYVLYSISMIMGPELVIILTLLKERFSLVAALLLMRLMPIIRITVISDSSLPSLLFTPNTLSTLPLLLSLMDLSFLVLILVYTVSPTS